jgi:hypothetical protein
MKRVLGLAFIFGLSAVAAEAASLQFFTDRATFEAAAGNLKNENFNGVVGEPSFNGATLTVGDLTLRNDNDFGRGFIDQPPFLSPSNPPAYDVDGTANANLLTAAQIAGQDDFFVDIGFAAPITAFGADFSAFNSDVQRSFFEVLGQTFNPPITQGSVVQFIGFVSDTAFTQLRITGSNFTDGFGMDNIAYGPVVTAVPLPPAALFLASALAALGMVRRRG